MTPEELAELQTAVERIKQSDYQVGGLLDVLLQALAALEARVKALEPPV